MTGNTIIDDVDLCGAYGDSMADVYDELYPATPGVLECADTVAELAGPGGSVLEFGVGTGRIARPLADRGLRVTGVDASRRMLERLAAHDPEGAVTPVHASFGTVAVAERFDVVLGAFNALCCAPTQDEQITTLGVMRQHLAPGGRIVLETFEPRRQHGQRAAATTLHPLGHQRALLESVQVIPESQLMLMVSMVMGGERHGVSVGFLRYVWPTELDLMARLAGLELVDRWGGWTRSPFEADSAMCISVYSATDR